MAGKDIASKRSLVRRRSSTIIPSSDSVWTSAVIAAFVSGLFQVGISMEAPDPAPSSNGCAVLIHDVEDAVKAGVDNPALLKKLKRRDCDMDPVAVAQDIRNGP